MSECLCKNCGKKIPSHELMFDFTRAALDFLKANQDRILIPAPAVAKGVPAEGNMDTVQEIYGLLRLLPDGPFMFSEAEISRGKSGDEYVLKLTQEAFMIKLQKAISNLSVVVGNIGGRNPVEVINNITRSNNEFIVTGIEYPQYEFAREFRNSARNNKKLADVLIGMINGAIFIKSSEILRVNCTGDGAEGDIKFRRIKYAGGRSITDERLCPFCSEKVSYYSGAYKEMVVTVLGSPRVSKTTVLSSCISFLQDLSSVGQRSVLNELLPISISESPDEGWRTFNNDCLSRYKKNMKPKPTDKNKDAIPKFSVKMTVERNGRVQNLVFTVIDIPGEFNGINGIVDEVNIQYAELYKNIDCIWYCTDLAEMMSVQLEKQANADSYKQRIDEFLQNSGYDLGRSPVETTQIISNMGTVASMFKRAYKDEHGENVISTPPTLLVLGKTDLKCDAQGSVYNPAEAYYYDLFNEYGIENYNRFCGIESELGACIDGFALFNLMVKWRSYMKFKCEKIVNMFEECFPKHGYCAMSAYGGVPEAPDNYRKKYMAGFPMIWMLMVCGFLDISCDVDASTRRARREKYKIYQNKTLENNMYMVNRDNWYGVSER